MTPHTWRCQECNDEMPAKYQTTHPALCATVSRLINAQVDRLIERLSPEEDTPR